MRADQLGCSDRDGPAPTSTFGGLGAGSSPPLMIRVRICGNHCKCGWDVQQSSAVSGQLTAAMAKTVTTTAHPNANKL